ncbi:hypothetical protein ACWDSJ_18610 [Nocardia sp. NPDC003482]
MFTPEHRGALRDSLIRAAHADPRVVGAAVTGSGAVGREDDWSDIDLALSVAADADHDAVLADWTARMYADHGAVAHLDVFRGATRFRVFLLDSTLQVDLAFWRAEEFGATAPTFRLLFGVANEPKAKRIPPAAELVGMGWLYALHARSSLARGRLWQAEYMISGIRDQVLALACLRHGLATDQARGIDELPETVTAPVTGALVRELAPGELHRAFGVAVAALLAEARHADPALADRLTGPLRELLATSAGSRPTAS